MDSEIMTVASDLTVLSKTQVNIGLILIVT